MSSKREIHTLNCSGQNGDNLYPFNVSDQNRLKTYPLGPLIPIDTAFERASSWAALCHNAVTIVVSCDKKLESLATKRTATTVNYS